MGDRIDDLDAAVPFGEPAVLACACELRIKEAVGLAIGNCSERFDEPLTTPIGSPSLGGSVKSLRPPSDCGLYWT